MRKTSAKQTVRLADLPPLTQQAISATVALVKTAAAPFRGRPMKRDRPHRAACLRICRNCDFWCKRRRRCTVCGCHGQWKAVLSGSDCPKGKWPPLPI